MWIRTRRATALPIVLALTACVGGVKGPNDPSNLPPAEGEGERLPPAQEGEGELGREGEIEPPGEGEGEGEGAPPAEGEGEPPAEGEGEFVQPEVQGDPGGAGFGSQCEAGAECQSGICAEMPPFTLCSKFCEGDEDCPPENAAGRYDCEIAPMVDGRQARFCFFVRKEQ